MNKYLSVIIPVYKTEEVIEKCLDSIKEQTLDDMEVIIVDDSNTDDKTCFKLIEPYLKDKRFKYISHEKNKGLLEARRTGVEISDSKFITFVDSDDFINDKDAFKKLKETQESNGDCSILQFGAKVLKKTQDEMYEYDAFLKYPTLGQISGKNAVIQLLKDRKMNSFIWGKLLKTDLLKKTYELIPRDLEITMHEDLLAIFIFSTMDGCDNYIGVDHYFYTYVRSIGITSKISEKCTDIVLWEKFLSNGKIFSIMSDVISNKSSHLPFELRVKALSYIDENNLRKLKSALKMIYNVQDVELKSKLKEMILSSFGNIVKSYL